MTTSTTSGARGESFADVARRLGSIGGVPVPPTSTDAQVMALMMQGGISVAQDMVENRLDPLYADLHLFGPTSAYVGEQDSQEGTYIIAKPVARDTIVAAIRVAGGSVGGMLRIVAFTAAGAATASATATIGANAPWQQLELSDEITVPANGYVGIDAAGGVYRHGSGGAWDVGAFYAAQAATSFNPNGQVYGTRLGIEILQHSLVIVADDFQAAQDTVATLLSMTRPATFYAGRQSQPTNAGALTGGATLMLGQQIPTDGRVSRIEVFAGSAGGSMAIKRFVLIDNANGSRTATQVGTDYVVTLTAGQLNSFDIDDFGVNGGEYLAFFAPDNAIRNTADPETNFAWFFGGGGNRSTFTIDAGNTGSHSRLEVRILVTVQGLKEEILRDSESPPAEGNDRIVRRFTTSDGTLRAAIGFQNTDSQQPQGGFYRVYNATGDSHFDFTSYQYGAAINGYGRWGHFMEFQLESDVEPEAHPELSIRHRTGGPKGSGKGSRSQTRNSPDTVGFGISFFDDDDPHLWLEDNGHPDIPMTIGYKHPRANGSHYFSLGGVVRFRVEQNSVLIPNSAEPDTPEAGGRLFVQDGALKFKGSSGTVTTIAPA